MADYTLTCDVKAVGCTPRDAYLGRVLVADAKSVGFNGSSERGVFPLGPPSLGTRLYMRRADGTYIVVRP